MSNFTFDNMRESLPAAEPKKSAFATAAQQESRIFEMNRVNNLFLEVEELEVAEPESKTELKITSCSSLKAGMKDFEGNK